MSRYKRQTVKEGRKEGKKERTKERKKERKKEEYVIRSLWPINLHQFFVSITVIFRYSPVIT